MEEQDSKALAASLLTELESFRPCKGNGKAKAPHLHLFDLYMILYDPISNGFFAWGWFLNGQALLWSHLNDVSIYLTI